MKVPNPFAILLSGVLALLIVGLALLARPGPAPPRPVYAVTVTRAKLFGADEVRSFRAFGVDKHGWLGSDRIKVYLADGTTEVLYGRWNVKSARE